MLLGSEVHGICKVVADVHRHPEIGRAQTLWIVVLCPKCLIDSFPLSSAPKDCIPNRATQDHRGKFMRMQGQLSKRQPTKAVTHHSGKAVYIPAKQRPNQPGRSPSNVFTSQEQAVREWYHPPHPLTTSSLPAPPHHSSPTSIDAPPTQPAP